MSRQVAAQNPQKVPLNAVPLQAGAAPPRAPAKPAAWYLRAHANQGLNGRLPGAVYAKQWKRLWSAPVPKTFAVLERGDRVLAQQFGSWTLLDKKGKTVASETSGRGPVVIEEAAESFLFLAQSNSLEVRALADADKQFEVVVGFAPERYAWSLFARVGNRIITAGSETEMFSHEPHPAAQSLIPVSELASPLKLDEWKQAELDRSDVLYFDDPKMFTVLVAGRLVAVLRDNIAVFDESVTTPTVFRDEFVPLQVASDETGLLYLVVRVGAVHALWVVSLDGKRSVAAPLKPEHATGLVAPPVIGYDHRIHLVTGSLVVALSPDGTMIWERSATGTIAGAGISADGHVVIGAGRQVVAYDPGGNATILHEMEDAITSVPVLTAQRELLVATESGVHCLVPKQASIEGP